MQRFLIRFLFLMLCSRSLLAAIESYEFQSDEQRVRYQQLTEELRCPKCQNQNLADSESQIAADLRKELHQQLLDGKSDDAIIDFMRDRYGDFVLYKPRVQRNTLLLWVGPIGLMLLVSGLLWHARRSAATLAVSPASAVACVEKSQVEKSQVEKPQPARLVTARWVNCLSLLVLIAVAVGSLLLYKHLGSLQAVQITDLGQTVFSRQLSPDQQQTQQKFLLSELDDWLGAHSDDDKFIYMRARLLSEMGVWNRAATDYSFLVGRFPEQDNFFAEYAQVLFLQNNRSMTPDILAYLKQALTLNPHNVTALGLLGMSAFEQKDYHSAVDFWQRLLRVIPPGTPQAEAIAQGVSRAKDLGGLPADSGADDIHVRVSVSIAGASQAKPDETVFVLLRAVNGPRMPLAVVRTTVSALAQPVVLDTATSPMRGQLDMAAIENVEVVARLSRSGQPMAVAGDWEGVSEPLSKSRLPAQLDILVERQIKP